MSLDDEKIYKEIELNEKVESGKLLELLIFFSI